MSQDINIDCPFANYSECVLNGGLCIYIGEYDEDNKVYEFVDEYCAIQSCLVSWVDERIKQSKCAICMPCRHTEGEKDESEQIC